MGARAWVTPLLGSSLVFAGLVAREVLSTTWPWLAYNLVLAWIPLLLAAVASRRPEALVALVVPWLLFLPNAPYLLTDQIHLRPRAHVPLWFDAALLGGTGALGLWMGVVSVHLVVGAVKKWAGPVAAGVVLVGAPLLSGFGMYLGRFQRWNSWDLVTRPDPLFRDVLGLILHPLERPEALGFTVTFGALFLVATLVPHATVPPAPERGTIG